MSNVTPFPINDLLEHKVEDSARQLQYIYDTLEKAERMIHELELTAKEHEAMFDVTFEEYMQAAGLQSVKPELLKYYSKAEDVIYEQKEK